MGNFLKGMAVITVMALLYIHLQMSIYALAYEGKKKEIRIEKLAENNLNTKSDILRMKSSDHIGRQLLGKENSYQFASRRNVVEVEAQAPNNPLMAQIQQQGQGLLGRAMTLAFSKQ